MSFRALGAVRRTVFASSCLMVSIVGFGTATAPSRAAAQDLGTAISQIVTIDRQRLFSDTIYGRRVVEAVETARQQIRAENQIVETELRDEERRLTEQKTELSPEAFRKLADEFDAKVEALRVKATAREQEFASKLEQDQAEFFERIGPVLGQLVRELGAVVILDQRAILLTTQNIDITELALQRIDSVLGDGSAPINQAPATDDGAGVSGTNTLPAPADDVAPTPPNAPLPADN
ncbi:OmpH family outer membrane protein [Aliiroseovarius sp. 2305UL8-7]|uniref:OmpH family outer membrane protein n=1 Tax=Aliiroseovarius conchicola TaxID=3121637 RepID=UPI003528F841